MKVEMPVYRDYKITAWRLTGANGESFNVTRKQTLMGSVWDVTEPDFDANMVLVERQLPAKEDNSHVKSIMGYCEVDILIGGEL